MRKILHRTTVVFLIIFANNNYVHGQAGALLRLLRSAESTKPSITAGLRAAEEANMARIAARSIAEAEIAAKKQSELYSRPSYSAPTYKASSSSINSKNKYHGVKGQYIAGIFIPEGHIVRNELLGLGSIKNLDIYVSMPKNAAEFKNIFKKSNRRQLNAITPIYNSIIEEDFGHVFMTGSAKNFFDVLSKKTDKKPLVLIGHNSGGRFYFPDGSSNSFRKMDSVAKANFKIIIFLSCNAMEYSEYPAVNHFLTYKEAFGIVQGLDSYKYAGKDQKQVKKELQGILNEFAYYRDLGIKIKVICIGAGLAGAGYGVYIIDRKDEKPKAIRKAS